MNKPRVKFCWACGNKLCGNIHTEMMIDGHARILHKSCGRKIEHGIHDQDFDLGDLSDDELEDSTYDEEE